MTKPFLMRSATSSSRRVTICTDN